jgi:hypothetical protein
VTEPNEVLNWVREVKQKCRARFINCIYKLAIESKEFKLFEKAYSHFKRKAESDYVIRKYMVKGLLPKTHEVKDVIQWMFLYLGLVETLGNSTVDILTMLLVANGIDFHVEYRHITPRIKHAVSPKDLEQEFVPLKTKLNFLEENGIKELASVIDSELRNDIAHSRFQVRGDTLYIKGKPATELLLKNTLKLVRACRATKTILANVAKERGLNKGGSELHD